MSRYQSLVARAGVVGLLLLAGTTAGDVRGIAATRESPPSGACEAPPPANAERSYVVAGRVRLLLFWTGRHEVGSARITWTGAADGARGFELLIGTDPDRAPRHLNRWGYEAETLCGSGASLLGVMTQSDEETMDDATTNITTATEGGGHPYKAVRATFADGQTSTEIFRLSLNEDLTYRDLGALLAHLPPEGMPRHAPMPANADAGFLASVAAVLHDTVTAYTETGRIATPSRRQYVYAGKLYDLTLKKARVRDELTLGSSKYRHVIDGDFETRNLTTRETTSFQIAYGTADRLAEVPLQIRYHPRWWLALELMLKE